MRRRTRSRTVAAATGLALIASLFSGVPAPASAPAGRAPALQQEKSVPGRNAKVAAVPTDGLKDAVTRPPTVTWPAPGTAVATLTGASPMIAAGTLPVRVGASAQAKAAAPASVRVELLSQRLDGPVLRLARADGVAKAAQVSVTTDYSGYRNAYGDDWALRLRLASLPACGLTTPARPDCRATMLPTTNDGKGHLTADTTLAATGTSLLAVTAASSGSAGDTGASALGPSATWQAGGSSGDFSWSYPMQSPPSLGGPAPKLAVTYTSGSVDGRTSATNNQPSWAGEGFDFTPGGYIERRYTACAQDTTGGNNVGHKTGDLCWRTDNATFALDGKGGELVQDDTTKQWHPRSDDGSRVERLTGASNGDNDGEYWKITTRDGTQYFFGLNRLPGYDATRGDPAAQSTWTAPVYGNQTGEPCHTTTFASSFCAQAWRWNLDYVVDPHGNTMSYFYTPETSSYGRNLTASTPINYNRSGYLNRIDYGQHDGAVYTSKPVGQVVIDTADRCNTGTSCSLGQPTTWPDAPVDQYCAPNASSCTHYTPTFWTQKRLAKITTKVQKNGTLQDVNAWTFTHDFRDPGDGTRAGLWLVSVQRTGLVGGSLALPPTTFDGVQMPNRVDGIGDGILPMNWWRVSAIHSETGGLITITYSNNKDCAAPGNLPGSPDTNGKRCYPIKWTPPNGTADITDWFTKYVVSSVAEKDLTTEEPAKEAQYTYLDAPAWHHDDEDGLVPTERKSWSQWRGYWHVQVREGHSGDTQTLTDTRYFRGMDGDLKASGPPKSVKIADSAGGSWPDTNQFAGTARESAKFVSVGGALLSRNIDDPWLSAPTATSVRSWGTTKAFMVQQSKAVETDAQPSGALVQKETDNTYNARGVLQQSNERNDIADPDDDTCTRYTYAAAGTILDAPSQVEKVADPCDKQPSRPDDVLSDQRVYYDGSDTLGAAPVRGDVTRKDELFGWTSGAPDYRTTARTTYDQYGRPLEAADVYNRKTTTAYTPATGALPTTTTATNPLGQVVTSTLEPAWGTATSSVDPTGGHTDTTYDPLGRKTQVWLPGRDRATQTPSEKVSYLVRTDGPDVVTDQTLQADGSYTAKYDLLDGTGRDRQTQTPAPGGGRVVVDHIYDARGLEVKNNGPYYNDAPPGTDVLIPDEAQLPAQTVTTYDGAGRPTTSTFNVEGVKQWSTTNSYDGKRQDIDPPDGQTPTTRILDARGNLVELRQYKGNSPTGDYDKTTYTYDDRNQLTSVTDQAGNVWRYKYDLRGRKIESDDPDSGVTTYTYGNADELLTQTDARAVTLAFEYDALGRKIAVHDGSPTGPVRTSWTYDTLADGTPAPGLLASSTRYVDGDAYVSKVTGYDRGNRPTGVALTIPASEGKLAGTYQYGNTYTANGQLKSTAQPAMGGLPGETLTYGYDGLDEPSTLSGTTSYVTNTVYTPFGEPQQLTMSAGGSWVKDTFEYQEGTRMMSRAVIDRQTAPGRVQDLRYGYDSGGNLTRIADQPGTASGQADDVQCFTYDYLRRLTSAWTPASGDCGAAPTATGLGGPAPYWQSWTFDGTGNRIGQQSTTPSGGTTTDTYSYPQPGQANPHGVQQITSNGPSGPTTSTYGYDPTGNTIRRPGASGGQTLGWDSEGLLSKVTENGKATSFVYDADGNELIRHDPDGATLYVGGNELHVNIENETSAVRYYTFSGQTIAVRRSDGTLSWLGSDNHGTPQIAIDASSQAVQRQRSTPFGGPRGTALPSWPSTKGFVGGTTEGSTGLLHLGARDYDQATGRFISVDPEIDYTDPQRANGYAYANNSPVTFSDADGKRYVTVQVPATKIVHHVDTQQVRQKITTWIDQWSIPDWAKGIIGSVWNSAFVQHWLVPKVTWIVVTVVRMWDEVVHYMKSTFKWVQDRANKVAESADRGLRAVRHFTQRVQARMTQIRPTLANAFKHLGDTASTESTQLGLFALALIPTGIGDPLVPFVGAVASGFSGIAFALHSVAALNGATVAPTDLAWDLAGVATLGLSGVEKAGVEGGEAASRLLTGGSIAPLLKSLDLPQMAWMWIPHTPLALATVGFAAVGCLVCLLNIPLANAAGDPKTYAP